MNLRVRKRKVSGWGEIPIHKIGNHKDFQLWFWKGEAAKHLPFSYLIRIVPIFLLLVLNR